MVELKCLRCQGEMEKGFLPEHVSIGSLPLRWFKGEPQVKVLFPLTMTGKDACIVTAYRCQACGYLELYASE